LASGSQLLTDGGGGGKASKHRNQVCNKMGRSNNSATGVANITSTTADTLNDRKNAKNDPSESALAEINA